MSDHHYVHHDFKEEVTELIEDFGLSPNEAHAVARGWINDLSASNPHLYNILEANHAHGCKTCKKDLTARVKLFSNRIRINAEPVAMPEPPSPPKLPNTTEKSAGSNPYFDDPSGRNGIYIRIPIPYSRDIRDVLVKPGTPEHQNLDKSIRNHFGGKIGLNELASAYHIPGHVNNLQFDDYGNGFTTTHSARKNYYENLDHSFLSEVIHDKNQNDEPYVNWGIMENRTGNPRLALNYMRGLIPAYQKGGVSKITTQATGKNPDHYRNPNDKKNSQERWNGSTTWANLGFDFGERPGDEYFHPGNIADNVRDYLKFKHFDHPGTDEASDAKVKSELDHLERPHEFLHYLKSSPEFKKIGNHKDLFDAAVNYEYPAELPLNDPKHPGYQRAMRLLGNNRN